MYDLLLRFLSSSFSCDVPPGAMLQLRCTEGVVPTYVAENLQVHVSLVIYTVLINIPTM